MDPVDGLVDRFGRTASDLRISLTDKCSLRCSYCMPAEGLTWLRGPDVLSDDETLRLAQVFVNLGVRSIRLTGGEPLLRRNLPDVVRRLGALKPAPELSLTTNGIGLAGLGDALGAAGLGRVNVSLDTLARDRFRRLTRRDRLGDVLAGIEAAAQAGLNPVKINTVVVRDENLEEAPALAEWALRHGYELRFIEHMPLDADRRWSRAEMVTSDEVLDRLQSRFVLHPLGHGSDGAAPAESFAVTDGPGAADWPVRPGRLGVIASVTRPFCRDCDRLRLTADGQLRTCLFARDETDLRAALRAGADDGDLAALIRGAVSGKQAGHGIGAAAFVQPARPMSAIGG